MARFLKSKADQGCAAATLNNYRWRLGRLAAEHLALPLDPAAVQASVKAQGGQAWASHDHAYRHLRTFYLWLVEWDYLASQQNPFKKIPKPVGKPPVPRVLTVMQLRRLVEVSRAPFERALVMTLIDSMARIGELAGRTKDHLAGRSLLVEGKTGQRYVTLSPDVAGYLADLPTHSLFPQLGSFGGNRWTLADAPATVEALSSRARAVMLRSGLSGAKLGPHTIRHSAATHYINQGGDVVSLSKLLGHTTITVTERYVNLAREALEAKHDQHGVWGAIRGLAPVATRADIEDAALPPEAAAFPLEKDGLPALLFLSQDRRPEHTYYYIRAREAGRSGRDGARKWHICAAGADLPLEEVDGLRLAISRDNQRRLAALAKLLEEVANV